MDAEITYPTSTTFTYQGDTSTLNQVRSDLRSYLEAHDIKALIPDAELVLSELASNAIEASPLQPFDVALRIAPGTLVIVVANLSTAEIPDESAWKPDRMLAPSGRGLSIVNALSASVSVASESGRVVVTATLAMNDR
jgi:anti-sigma regulatory factor (Ser/Thr protein kinase)